MSYSSWKVERPTSAVPPQLAQSNGRPYAPAARASARTSQIAIVAREAAPIISRWVGLHMVTSIP